MKYFVYLFLFQLALDCSGQQVGVNSITKKEIDTYIRAEMKAEQIPGLSYAVVHNGTIIDSGAYGFANVELKAPVTFQTLFNIGSIGKTFTSTAIMLLQTDGKLSLNDPITKYLDSLPDSWSKITIKHLLSHTSGIKDYAHDFPGYPFIQADRKQEITETKFIHMAAELLLNFQPGERWAYSNSNFVLLGFIIHKLAGKPTGDFIKERIFGPAKMKETRYTDVRNIIFNRASGYLLDEDDNNKLINGNYISNFFSTMGDMGILTTASDLARWSIAQDNTIILDKQTLEQVWTPSKLNTNLEAMGIAGPNYGLGWTLANHRGYKEVGHGGSFMNGYTASFHRFPEENFAVIVLTNLNPTNVSSMAYHLAGFFIPGLKGIDQLQSDNNADTSFNKSVEAFFESLGTGNYDRSLVTESFMQRVNPIAKKIFSGPAKPAVIFVASDKMGKRRLERYGVSIQKINYYKIQWGPETHYFSIYLDADNKIADMRGY